MQGLQHCRQGPDLFNKPIILKKKKKDIKDLAISCVLWKKFSLFSRPLQLRMYMLMLSWQWKRCDFQKGLIRKFQVGAVVAFTLFSWWVSFHWGLLCGSRVTLIPDRATYPDVFWCQAQCPQRWETKLPKNRGYKFLVRMDTSFPMEELPLGGAWTSQQEKLKSLWKKGVGECSHTYIQENVHLCNFPIYIWQIRACLTIKDI